MTDPTPTAPGAYVGPRTGRTIHPGTVIGYTRRGVPIPVIAGGSEPAGEPAPAADPPAPAPPTAAPSPANLAAAIHAATNPQQRQANPPSAAPVAPASQPPVRAANGQFATSDSATAQPAAPANPWDGYTWDGKVDSLPEPVADTIRALRAENAATRTTAKQQAADEARTQLMQDISRALGIADDGDQPPDPAQLTEQIEAAQAAAWRTGVENQVLRMAARLGANPDGLLDSMAFIQSLDDLVDADPSTADFATQMEQKIRDAMGRNPAFKVAPPPAPRSGSDLPGGPTPPRQRPAGLHAAVGAHYQQHG